MNKLPLKVTAQRTITVTPNYDASSTISKNKRIQEGLSNKVSIIQIDE